MPPNKIQESVNLLVDAEADASYYLVVDARTRRVNPSDGSETMAAMTQAAIDQARNFGLQHREAYINEFGGEPVEGEIGDWDSTGLGQAWDDLTAKFEINEDDQAAYDELRAAYLSALFATDAA